MSFTELLILAVIGLVILGPEELPIMARKLAKYVNEIRKVKDEILGPLTDVRDSTSKFVQETRELMTKDLSELVSLRDELNQEISRRQNASPATPAANQATSQEQEQAQEPRPIGTPPLESPENTVSRLTDPAEPAAPEKPTNGQS